MDEVLTEPNTVPTQPIITLPASERGRPTVPEFQRLLRLIGALSPTVPHHNWFGINIISIEDMVTGE